MINFLKSSAQLIVLVCIVQYFVVFNWYRQSAKKVPSPQISSTEKTTSGELKAFLKDREYLYNERRERTMKYCKIVNKPSYLEAYHREIDLSLLRMKKIYPGLMIYDETHKAAYCKIHKAGSTMWVYHFLSMLGIDVDDTNKHASLKAQQPWPFNHQSEVEIRRHLTNVTSVVVTRNPMTRIPSAYHQKFIQSREEPGWSAKTAKIMMKLRKNLTSVPQEKSQGIAYPGDDPYYLSPAEFLHFVLDPSMPPDTKNPHWRPQHISCPFCLINFTIYGDVEQLDDDEAYFAFKMGMKLNIGLKRNPSLVDSTGQSPEFNFWSRIPEDLILRVYQMYWMDFELMRYPFREYLAAIGLKAKVGGITVDEYLIK